MGVTANVKLSSFTAGFLLVMVALIVVLNLVNSRSGRAIMALRDNRIAAESVGISATKYKLMAFVTSAVLAGAAGALYAMNYSSIAAKKFDFNTSILILVYVVLGGLGNIRGSVIAAALLYVLPELLRDFYDYRMLIYAIVLILVMLATNNEHSKEFFCLPAPEDHWAAAPRKEALRMAKEFEKGKMVPVPSHSIVPERDVDKLPVLECQHLGIDFGGLTAVNEFNLTIGRTEIAGLIGPNGAGKTTVFNLLTKVYQPTRGTILLDGMDTSRHEHCPGQPGRHRPHLPEHPPVFQPECGGQREDRPAQPDPLPHVGRRAPPPQVLEAGEAGPRRAPWSCCPSSTCRTWPTTRPAPCPTAHSAAWRSSGPWPPTPPCFCWTSPPPA